MRGARTPQVRFDPDEVAALLLARKTLLAALDGSPHARAIGSALAKIELLQEGCSYRGRRGLPDVFQSSFDHAPRHAEFRDVLIEAALARHCVRLRYFTAEREAESERVVEPYHVHHDPHGLHLIAYCLQRRDFLYFSIHRVRAVEVLDLGFDPTTRPLDLDAFLASTFDGRRGPPSLTCT